MNLYNSIIQRKSSRQYDMQPLSPDTLNKIETAIEGFTKLFPQTEINYRFSEKTKGTFNVKAPHYLIISGSGKDEDKISAGFLFQQLNLWFDAMEIGCVWLGATKDAKLKSSNDIIVMAFGNVTEPVHRTIDEFKRKPIEEITNSPDDICIKAVHLAPSGMNTQPWYFEKEGGKVLVYKQKLKPPISLFYKHTDVDMGIGLCHYALACNETGKPFNFTNNNNLPEKKGYISLGIID